MMLILNEQRQTECASGRAKGGDLWLSAVDLELATGWSMKPEGLCKGDMCVPLSSAKTAALKGDGDINVSGFWRLNGAPLVSDASGSTWVLGMGAGTRVASLATLEAPDFALPDINGHIGTLSQHRGKKVLIATWASW